MTDVNILDLLPERTWGPFDEMVCVQIGLSGLHYRVLAQLADEMDDEGGDRI